jgi:hypothetical protein
MRMPSLSQLPQAILCVCLAASFILFLTIGIASVTYPYDLDYGEAQIADQAHRALTGGPQYKSDLNVPPYVISNYPPLYPLLVGAIGLLGRLPLVPTGRAISLLSALLSASLVGAFASDLSRRRFAGVLSAGLFLGNLYVLIWAPLARVDMLGLALSLLGLWLVYRRWRSRLWLSVAVLCLAAAVYTRQSYLMAAPTAAAIWLWSNDRRRALGFAGVLAIGVVVIFLVLNSLTQGGFYLHTVWVNSLGSFRAARVLAQGWTLLMVWPVAMILAGAGLATALRPAKGEPPGAGRDEEAMAFLRYGLFPYTIAALLAAQTVGKIGSDVNYFLEFIAALSIWAGYFAARALQRGGLRRSAVLAAFTAQVILMLILGVVVANAGVGTKWSHRAEYDRVADRVRAAVRQGQVLADDGLGMVVFAGQPIYFQPFDYRQLYAAGQWDPSGLIGEIKARRFPLIMLNLRGSRFFDERWIPSIVEAIDASYCPSEGVDGLVLYVPSTTPCVPTR